MKKLALIFATAFLVSGAAAQSFTVQEDNLEQFQSEINSHSDEVPGVLASLIGDQTINLRLELNGTEETIGVDMNGTKIGEIQMETYEEATLEVNVSQQQIRELSESENPLKLLSEKIEEGEIEYSTSGRLNSLRFFLAEQLLTVVSLL